MGARTARGSANEGPVLNAENEPPTDPDAEREPANKGLTSGKVVKFIGLEHAREINEEAWRNVGSRSPFCRWDRSNGYMVDAAILDDAALDYCDKVDTGFVVMDMPVRG